MSGPAVPSATIGPGNAWAFLTIVLELGLLLGVVHLFQIEAQRHFLAILSVAVVGFVIHAALPSGWRLGFFTLLSLGSVLFVLGWPNGVWVLGLGAGLLALCYLPLPLKLRVALVAVAVLALAVFRMGSVAPFWPVLGSMFMLRLVVFLYDNRHEAKPPPVLLSVAYFFPLPNVCFTFFPVLDFKTFRDTYTPSNAFPVYQVGVEWLVRGVTHLIAYRIVKYYVLPSPFDLHGPADLFLFLASNYALYLHISGHFHLITGLLHLFGFGLPPTHHHYFLASSCTDVWRRINIYWKDFMTKVFFFPAFFALRGLGTRTAMALAALWVILVTWLLHSYQFFWLVDVFPLNPKDAVLWFVVGLLVAANLQRDLSRARHPAPSPATLARAALQSLQVVAMFTLVSIFWAAWTMPGFLGQAPHLLVGRTMETVGLLLGVALIGVLVGVSLHQVRETLRRGGLWPFSLTFGRSAAIQIGVLAILLAVASPPATAWLPEAAREVVSALRRDAYTPAQAAQLLQGYYEEITAPRVQAGALLQSLEGRRPPDPGIRFTDISRVSDDLLERELIPGWTGEIAGRRLTVNRHGLRDRADLTLEKHPGVCRVAVLGSSIVMGFGVADEEAFPRLLENRLNAERAVAARPYELVNFGMGMSVVTHRRVLLDRKVLAFHPDVLYYVAHPDEFQDSVRHLGKLIARKRELPYPSLREAVSRAGITPDLSRGDIEVRLRKDARRLVGDLYAEMVEVCKREGMIPVWIYLPVPAAQEGAARTVLVQLAREAGFTVIDLSGWQGARSAAEVLLTPTDHHLNALGHRLVADRLFEAVRELPACGELRNGRD